MSDYTERKRRYVEALEVENERLQAALQRMREGLEALTKRYQGSSIEHAVRLDMEELLAHDALRVEQPRQDEPDDEPLHGPECIKRMYADAGVAEPEREGAERG